MAKEHVRPITDEVWPLGWTNPVNTGTLPGYGYYLKFLGGPAGATYDSENSDPLWLARYNRVTDESSLRMNVGDGDGAPGIGMDVDRFEIGHTNGGTWYPTLCVTGLGGICIALYNETGAASEKGRLVRADPANDDSVIYSANLENEALGVFLEDGIADGSLAWIVTAGIGDVALDTNTGTTAGNWLGAGAAGYCDGTNAAPVPARHWEEIGHVLETVAAAGPGTNVLSRCLIHFN